MKHHQTHRVEISYKTVLFTFAFIVGMFLLFILRDVIIGLFIAILVATALNPAVNALERIRIPRPAAILMVYILIITIISLLVATILPPLLSQTSYLLSSLPLDAITSNLQILELNLENVQLITNQLGSFAPFLRLIGSTFSGLITFFTFAVITFYILMERKNLHKYLSVLFGTDGQEARAELFVNKIEQQIGGWIRGELALMFIVGLITYIGLSLLNVPYALALAIIAGLLELVPNIGPTISAIPAILIPLLTGQNPIMAIFVAALYIIVQQLENNFIVPRVMRTAVGVHPLVTILLIIIGLRLLGIAGAVLAVPVFLVTKVCIQEFTSIKKLDL